MTESEYSAIYDVNECFRPENLNQEICRPRVFNTNKYKEYLSIIFFIKALYALRFTLNRNLCKYAIIYNCVKHSRATYFLKKKQFYFHWWPHETRHPDPFDL